jgi:hypothetical protein
MPSPAGIESYARRSHLTEPPRQRYVLVSLADSLLRAARRHLDSEDGQSAHTSSSSRLAKSRDTRPRRTSILRSSTTTTEARPRCGGASPFGTNLTARPDPRPTPVLGPSPRPLPTRHASALSGGLLESALPITRTRQNAQTGEPGPLRATSSFGTSAQPRPSDPTDLCALARPVSHRAPRLDSRSWSEPPRAQPDSSLFLDGPPQGVS